MIPHFATKHERLKWLRENKHLVVHAKKTSVKHADPVCGINIGNSPRMEGVIKELGAAAPAVSGIQPVKAVINTTNYFDGHQDVHIPGLWKKSLAETLMFYLLQEHKAQFDKVISDNVKAYTRTMSWKSLRFDYEGSTQALIFDTEIKQDRNPFMYDQYANGFVKNHSVGMRYIKMFLCVNSEEKWWIEERDAWEKYVDQVVNQDDLEEYGMFWAITEAKINEGSAVLFGSNPATPTISGTEAGKQATPADIEPDQSTQPAKSRFGSIGAKIIHN